MELTLPFYVLNAVLLFLGFGLYSYTRQLPPPPPPPIESPVAASPLAQPALALELLKTLPSKALAMIPPKFLDMLPSNGRLLPAGLHLHLPLHLNLNLSLPLPLPLRRLSDAPLLAAAAVIGAALVVLPALYAGLAASVQPRLPTLRNKRICLLIAHPDDEAMFFAPAVLALTKPDTGNHVKILCLSSGDADGLGETRKKELQKSAVVLGLRAETDVFVVESPDFPDSMTTTWEKKKISRFLARMFTSRSAPSEPSIDVIITFDQHGISSHPNHISLYHGARTFVGKLARLAGAAAPSPVDLYTLTTVSMLRKYAGFSDAFTALGLWAVRGMGFKKPVLDNDEAPRELLYISPFTGTTKDAPSVVRARAAMTQAHLSQMRWFRWGWITLSRYMYLNELRLANPVVDHASSSSSASSSAPAPALAVAAVDEPEIRVVAADTDDEPQSEQSALQREKERYRREQERERERQRARERERVKERERARESEASETSSGHRSERKHRKHSSTKKAKK